MQIQNFDQCSKLNITNDQRQHYFSQSDVQSRRTYPCCVCYYIKSKKIVTISQVDYDVRVHSSLAIVNIKQIYENTLDAPGEIEYLFSISPNAAFTELKVTLGDRTLYGIIKEKEIAYREYLEGLEEGKTMLYSEKLADFPDVMRVKLGNLQPRDKLEVQFQYVEQLQVCVNEFWRLEIDPVVHPKYILDASQSKFMTNLKGKIDFSDYKPRHRQNIGIHIESVSEITFCKSPTHKILIEPSAKRNTMTIELDKSESSNFKPDKTFVLLFADVDIHKPQVYLTHTNNDALQHERYCATLSLIPQFNPLQLDDAYRALLNNNEISSNHFQYENKGIYVFLLDRSGSMEGIRIQKAKEALILFIKSLPQKSYFNVISFGSEYQLMFPEPQIYSQLLVNQAIESIESMAADMGGTAILEPLEFQCFNNFKNSNPYNIFILTDGAVTPDPILELVRRRIMPNIRVYTLGIGDGCSKYLIETLAHIGNGSFHFVTDNEDLNLKVIDLLEDSLTPYLQNIQYKTSIENIYSITPNPASIISIKKNKPLVIQVLFPEQENDIINIEFQAIDPQTKEVLGHKITISLADSKLQEHFHKIAAYRQIQIIESEIKYKDPTLTGIIINKPEVTFQDIVQISLTNQVISSSTAFICEIQQSDLNKQLKITEYRQKYSDNDDHQLFSRTYFQCKSQLNILDCLTNYKCPDFYRLDKNSILLNQTEQHSSSESRCQYIKDVCNKSFEIFRALIKKCKKTKYNNEPMDFQSQYQDNQILQGLQQVLIEDRLQDDIQAQLLRQKNEIKQESVDSLQQNQRQTIPYKVILKYIQIDGSVDSEILNLIPIKLPTDQIDYKFWIVIITLSYLELYCQSDKDAWQLLHRKGITFLQDNGIKYRDHKDQAVVLINDII